MRIQHNVLAMNAYRNYNTNTSALGKNLEKLSSGYKINRAGDDAAGLAISEKMRAQITGLSAAQKNVKDGISLVKTAEGAMQEIHDMLNRMDYLATQSANGTYDDPVDRANLQKEVDALKTEINRIADSANFNGIKLLDGSLSKGGVVSVKSKFDLPEVGLVQGKNTVLHRDENEADASTAFGLELHNTTFTGAKDDSFTIEIGGTKLIGTLKKDMMGVADDDTLTAKDIVAGLLGDDEKVKFTYEDGSDVDATAVKITGNDGIEREYELAANGDGTHQTTTVTEETGLLFKLSEADKDVEVSMDVKIYANDQADSVETGAVTGTQKTNAAVVPAVGGVTGRGTTNGTATVNVITSSGVVNRNAIELTKADGTGGAASVKSEPIGAFASGTAKPAADTKTTPTGGSEWEFTFEKDKINEALAAMADGATAIDSGVVTLVYDGTSGSEKAKLMVGSTEIGSADIKGTLTAGSDIQIKSTDGTTVLGTVKTAGTDRTGWNNNDTMVADTGLSVHTMKASAIAANSDEAKAFTAAAAAKGAATGDINVFYNDGGDTGKKLELRVGNTVIGTADEAQLSVATNLEFTSADGKSIGKVTLSTQNGTLSAADLKKSLTTGMKTGQTYTDARVTVTAVSGIEHEKLAEAVKSTGADIGTGKNLSIAYDGTSLNLMMGDTKIAVGSISSGEIDFKSVKDNSSLFKMTLSDNSLGAFGTLALDTSTAFNNIGLSVKPEADTLNTVDTTGLAAKKTEISAAAKAAGVTANGNLTISYNSASTGKEFELKIGDKVIGTANKTDVNTLSGGVATLNFADANSGALGAVKIGGLKAGFTGEDLTETIDTGLAYDSNATPAITAEFKLDTGKLNEYAKAESLDDGEKFVAKYNNGAWDLTLKSDGSTVAGGTLGGDGKTVTFAGADGTEYGTMVLKSAFNPTTMTASTDEIETGLSYGSTTAKTGLKGDIQISTTDQKNSLDTAGDHLASTVLTLKDDMIADGASIFVAGKNYTFSTNKDTVTPEGAVKVDISDLDAKALGNNYMSAVAKRLTDAYARDNSEVYTMGWNGKGITLTETVSHGKLDPNGKANDYADDGWDLSTMEGIAKSVGYSSAATKGAALTLQIGDTSEKFNQMDVSVGDMHTSAMGSKDGKSIADVDISTREGASDAVSVIKDAINYVSSVRGDLGATQNRLEHTANNLSVMSENIQDAESTIRDTDIAEEMMSYTKNNILVQAAQAMLAQANAIPQGVLQLLG